MDFKADALLLRAVDYGENDKIVTLLTAERGKIAAGMKGVKKASAKLKYASQPFCFAEYVLAEKGGRYTVTQACLHEGFYNLRTHIESFYAAATITEVCDAFAYEAMPSGELLVAAVEALHAIEAQPEAPMPATVAFLLRAVAFAGYPVTAGDCPVCGKKIVGRRYFDLGSGIFNCAECAVGVPASESTYAVIRALQKLELHSEEFSDGYIRALRLLRAYIARQLDIKISALEQFLLL